MDRRVHFLCTEDKRDGLPGAQRAAIDPESNRMTTVRKLKCAWKYRRFLWKYRRVLRYRREIGAGLLAAGAAVALVVLSGERRTG